MERHQRPWHRLPADGSTASPPHESTPSSISKLPSPPRSGLLPLLAALLLTSCAPQGERADLIFINGAEPEALDPAHITAQVGIRVASSLFEGLLRPGQDGRPAPGVAQTWETSDDGLRYTFHLRPDARWTNGDPVTAHDFIRSWQRILTPATGALYVAQLFPIKGARDFAQGKTTDPSTIGIAAPDDHTLTVELESPTPYFLDLCAFITLAPVHTPTIDAHGDRWTKPQHLVGNGPYRLVDWRLGDRIQLEKNPAYWDKENVAMQSIDILPIAEPNTAMNFFLTGAADLIMDKGLIPNTMVDALLDQPYFHRASFLGTYFLRFNVTRPPLDDPRVRQALAMAIDRRRIVEKITRLGEDAATSLVPPGAGDGYQPPPATTTFDPQGARALLAQAGFPEGKGFPLIEYLYMAKTIEGHIAVELQDMWARHLGINISLTKQEPKAYYASMRQLSYHVCRSSWVGDYNDPNTFLEMFVAGGGNNRTGYSSPAYDALIAQAARQSAATRYTTLQKAERLLISQDTVIAPIYHYVGVQFYHPEKLGGIRPNLIDHHPLQDMFWKK